MSEPFQNPASRSEDASGAAVQQVEEVSTRTVWTALLKTDEGWREVGTEGNFAHARNELREWVSSCRNEQFALGFREIPEWSVRLLDPNCGCMTCDPPQYVAGFWASRMYVCPTCGDKRCPGAGDHARHPADVEGSSTAAVEAASADPDGKSASSGAGEPPC